MAELNYPDNPRARELPSPKPWWQKPANIILAIVAVIIIGLVIAASRGALPTAGDDDETPLNQTEEPAQLTREEALVKYIIDQQAAGAAKEQITERLRLGGYTESEIERGYQIADPTVQYILSEQAKGTPQQEIVDDLLKAGIPPEQIQEKFSLAESTKRAGLGDALRKYWWLIAIGGAAYWWFYGRKDEDDRTKAPKVYTLEECRERAEEILKEKGHEHEKPLGYRNRPELLQYRYAYREPLYEEFNSHYPSGHKAGSRRHYLIAMGYDKELIDFRITTDDTQARSFLYDASPSYERSGAQTYHRLRSQSDKPQKHYEDPLRRPEDDNYYPPTLRRTTRTRDRRRPITPDPIGRIYEVE